ncbi:MAG: rRNA maturation RNase YbeY [Acidobacteria bacterium]|nr:rRNA maturation RNase YbeY [Acidobacteriota bacterium]
MRRTPVSRLTVTVSDGRGHAVRAPGLASWLTRVAPASARGDVAIALVSDARIRALNRQYRRKDRATDVLSFGAEQDRGDARLRRAAPHASLFPRPHLGDILIATPTARRQARAAGHSYAAELKVLALHGLLHLLGYDHADPRDLGRMARIERRLRAKGGLRGGLIERVTPATTTQR